MSTNVFYLHYAKVTDKVRQKELFEMIGKLELFGKYI